MFLLNLSRKTFGHPFIRVIKSCWLIFWLNGTLLRGHHRLQKKNNNKIRSKLNGLDYACEYKTVFTTSTNPLLFFKFVTKHTQFEPTQAWQIYSNGMQCCSPKLLLNRCGYYVFMLLLLLEKNNKIKKWPHTEIVFEQTFTIRENEITHNWSYELISMNVTKQMLIVGWLHAPLPLSSNKWGIWDICIML